MLDLIWMIPLAIFLITVSRAIQAMMDEEDDDND